MDKELTFQVSMTDPYDTTIQKVVTALKAEGFGVLTRIDVKAVIKEKLDADFRPYIILGACNPSLSHRALLSNPLVGLVLPCNVTVEETDGGCLVSIVNPEALLGVEPLSSDAIITEVAAEARIRMERVADVLRAG